MSRFDINNEEQMRDLHRKMRDLHRKMRPAGSGPLGVMRIAYELIEEIAKEKGFDLTDRPKEDVTDG